MSKGKREAPRPNNSGWLQKLQESQDRTIKKETGKRPTPAASTRMQREETVTHVKSNGGMKKTAAAGAAAGAARKKETGDFVRQAKRFYRRHRGLVLLGAALALILCLWLVFSAVWNSFVKPPDLPGVGDDQSGVSDKLDGSKPDGDNLSGDYDPLDALPDLNIDEEIPGYVDSQKEGVYTFLVLGRSDEDNYTDMIMLVVFDTNTGEVNIASIPRDLMINVKQDIKKINSVSAGGNVKAMKSWVRKTLGIQPNFYVLVDWQAVGDMVDAVGGVTFNVPFRMWYVDSTPETGFTIDLQPGEQVLDGDKAMQLIRWRKNNMNGTYAPGDSARMELQQQFIKAMAKQFLQPKNLSKIGAFATIFKENVQTDLSIGNLVWFATTALEKNSVSQLTFYSLPGNYEITCWSRTFKHLNSGRYQSYVTLYPNQLIELVNTKLNPYEYKISLSDLDLMSCTDRHIISSSTGVLADTTHDGAYAEWIAVQEGRAYYDKENNLIQVTVGKAIDTNGDGKADGIDVNDDGKVDYTDIDGDGIFDITGEIPVVPPIGGENTDPEQGEETTDPGAVENPEDPNGGEGEPTVPEDPSGVTSPSDLEVDPDVIAGSAAVTE